MSIFKHHRYLSIMKTIKLDIDPDLMLFYEQDKSANYVLYNTS